MGIFTPEELEELKRVDKQIDLEFHRENRRGRSPESIARNKAYMREYARKRRNLARLKKQIG